MKMMVDTELEDEEAEVWDKRGERYARKYIYVWMYVYIIQYRRNRNGDDIKRDRVTFTGSMEKGFQVDLNYVINVKIEFFINIS